MSDFDDEDKEIGDDIFPSSEFENLLWVNDLDELDFEELQNMTEAALEEQAMDTSVRNTTKPAANTTPLQPALKPTISIINKSDIKWSAMPFQTPNIVLKEIQNTSTTSRLPTPLDYFIKYFPESLFEEMAGFTQIYSQQMGVKNFEETSSNEIKVFVGVHLLMGVINFPRVRMYWQFKYRITVIADAITRNRFFQM